MSGTGSRLGRLAAILALLLVMGAAAGWFWLDASFRTPGPSGQETTVEIPRGEGVRGIARRLESAGLVQNALLFEATTRIFGGERPLKAGEYSFPPGASIAAIVLQLQEGRVLVRRLTVPEGLTVAEIMALVAAEPNLVGDLPPSPPEGRLLPETYNFVKGDSRADLIRRMSAAMDRLLAELLPGAAANLPYGGENQVLTLASIVEKETGIAAERPRVAGLFVNRLRAGMRLQSDPTVTYGITRGERSLGRELTRADLDAPTPYNTYAISALPPGPIANPGRASIEAVLHPLATDEFYFVADGTGGHAFARTLDEHNANVRRWRALKRGGGEAP